jgi:hypothetical protein
MSTYGAIGQQVTTTAVDVGASTVVYTTPAGSWAIVKILGASLPGAASSSMDLTVQVFDTNSSAWETLYTLGSLPGAVRVSGQMYIIPDSGSNLSGFAIDPNYMNVDIGSTASAGNGTYRSGANAPAVKMYPNMRILGSGNMRVYVSEVRYT